MDGFEEQGAEIEKLGGKVIAASVDDIEKAGEVAENKSFPVGYGVTRDIADKLGSWWEDRRDIIQPSEFILNEEGKVMVSSYSDGPLARLEATDVVKLINFYESQKK